MGFYPLHFQPANQHDKAAQVEETKETWQTVSLIFIKS